MQTSSDVNRIRLELIMLVMMLKDEDILRISRGLNEKTGNYVVSMPILHMN